MGKAAPYTGTWREHDAVDQMRVNTPPHPVVRQRPGWRGPLVEFSSWPEIPVLDLGRQEGGSANLAAALWVWQTRDFSSALCFSETENVFG